MTQALDAVRELTQGTPYEAQIWLVGGAVRDMLLGRQQPQDFDLVSEENVLEIVRFLYKRGLGDSPPITYANFGTAMLSTRGHTLEFITARRESYRAESRKPQTETATLLDDARRRDFTCNALLRNLHTNELYDPLGTGLQDLQAKILRTPLDPYQTFSDDPLRMLRAVRFKHQLGFEFAEGLAEAIRHSAPRLPIISPERIREEWLKMLVGNAPEQANQDLMELGLLHEFAPEFESMRGVEQGRYHHLDVWEHTLLVLKNLPKPTTQTLALAALLHDIGKPRTRSVDPNGHIRFFDHENVGSEMARALLNRLRFSNQEIHEVTRLVRNHMRLGSFTELSSPAARRLVRDMGPLLSPLLDLVEADASALRPGVRVLNMESIRTKLREVRLATPASALTSPLDGEAIMQITGCQAGPEVGRWKGAR